MPSSRTIGGVWKPQVSSFSASLIRKTLKKEISGEFERTRQSFGFVGDCFVPKSLVIAEKLSGYDRVTVMARKSWDKKKGHWSWTAIEVIEKNPDR
ncbi:hypothetical protein [Parvibacter caecicola]|uniref:hypothetical protein n=1 Tax=Parvibacter caecicola TaxID=747645 RepID=UPI003F73C82A